MIAMFTWIISQLAMAGIPGLTDLNRVHENAGLCRRTYKDLKDAQADAVKYNNRDRLFGLPLTSVRPNVTGS